MGKKLDALLGRTFKGYKFKALCNLAISRIAVLKNQRQVRCNQARSDVVQLLQLGHHDRALLRVEQVIKEQNMLDVFVMLEGYCNLVIERIHQIEQDRVCPEELKEAISSLLFASSRCGDFPELQEIRAVFTSWYGKEFAARAIELRNNCGVNTKIIQKMSTRQPDLKNRSKVLKEIATENSISLQLEETHAISSKEEILHLSKAENWPQETPGANNSRSAEGLHDTVEGSQKYKDVADAAQAAFESAAYAAQAARAAVELSRANHHDYDDSNDFGAPRKGEPSTPGKVESDSQTRERENDISHQVNQMKKTNTMKSRSSSSEDSAYGNVTTRSFDEVNIEKLLDKDIVLPESDEEFQNHVNDAKTDEDEDISEKTGEQLQNESSKEAPSSLHAGLKAERGQGQSVAPITGGSEVQRKNFFSIIKGPFSVRTRQVRGH